MEKAPLISVLEQLSDFENSDNLYLDPLHAVKSPVKTASGSDHILEQPPVFVNPESPGFGDIDSPDSLVVRRDSGDSSDWSTLNQFFPPGCLQTPQLQLRPERGASVGSHLLPSPSVLPSIREGDNTSSSKTVREVLSDNFETQDKMENTVLKTRLDAVAAAADKVERRLCNFGPEDVTLEDRSSYKEYLDENRRLFEAYQELVDMLVRDLDGTNEDEKVIIDSLQRNELELRSKLKKNTLEVKQRVSSLANAHDISRPINAAESISLELQRQKEKIILEEKQTANKLKTEKCELKMRTLSRNPILSLVL